MLKKYKNNLVLWAIVGTCCIPVLFNYELKGYDECGIHKNQCLLVNLFDPEKATNVSYVSTLS